MDLAPPAIYDRDGRVCSCATGYAGDPETACIEGDACESAPCGGFTTCGDLPVPAPLDASGRTCACSGEPMDALTWDGGCYESQVLADGEVTLIRTALDATTWSVTLTGWLDIAGQAAGDIRHALPPGFEPLAATPYTCELQVHETLGSAEGVLVGGVLGVHVRQADAEAMALGFTGGMLLFPDNGWNGRFDLVCTWQTEEAPPADCWAPCTGVAPAE